MTTPHNGKTNCYSLRSFASVCFPCRVEHTLIHTFEERHILSFRLCRSIDISTLIHMFALWREIQWSYSWEQKDMMSLYVTATDRSSNDVPDTILFNLICMRKKHREKKYTVYLIFMWNPAKSVCITSVLHLLTSSFEAVIITAAARGRHLTTTL